MSRSRRKHPFGGWAGASSEKRDKQRYNRRFRRVVKQTIQGNPNVEVLPLLREHSDPWDMAKDGKVRYNAKQYPKCMRK